MTNLIEEATRLTKQYDEKRHNKKKKENKKITCSSTRHTAASNGKTSKSGQQYIGVFAGVCKHDVVLVAFLMQQPENRIHLVTTLLALRRHFPDDLRPLASVFAYDIGCQRREFLQAVLPEECGRSKFAVGNWYFSCRTYIHVYRQTYKHTYINAYTHPYLHILLCIGEQTA